MVLSKVGIELQYMIYKLDNRIQPFITSLYKVLFNCQIVTNGVPNCFFAQTHSSLYLSTLSSFYV